MHIHLFFAKIFLVIFINECRCETIYEERAEFLDTASYNENKNRIEVENLFETFLQEEPILVAVELKKPTLENAKRLWNFQNQTTFSIKKIVLGAFNSEGLQNRSVYNETSKFVQGILDLKEISHERVNLCPTMHVLHELLQENVSNGTLLLITMSRPSDESFEKILAEFLIKRKCQLSILWAGERAENDFILLKNLATKTGGKFAIILNETNGKDDSTNFRRYHDSGIKNLENISEKFRFIEEEKETDGQKTTLTSRAADQKIWQKIAIPLIVEVASGANLEVRPGSSTQIPFNVKNNLNVPMQVFFRAKFNEVIQPVQPSQVFLQPSGSYTVVVNLRTLSNAQVNAIGTLTLLAEGANKVVGRSAIISLTPQETTDKTAPKIYYKYEGDCLNYKEPQNCENGQWGLTATLHDEDSGLLKILSEPYGLLFQSEFVAGTKTPVTVTYRATCCQPIVHIWAEDLKGNYIKKSFDVFNQNLLAGEIASIVLGVLLLILIIIGVIAAVLFVRRRNRRNMIIPRTIRESK